MLFSIVVPFYNVEKYAGKCIESIMSQTYRDFEAILVDDGSTDTTSEIIDDYAAKDARLIPLHKKNGGLTSARKAGTLSAKGEYIVPIDGDDWVDKYYLEEFAKKIDRYKCDICVSGYQENFDKEGKEKKQIPEENRTFYDREGIEKEILPNLFKQIPMVWSKAFKQSLYIKYQMMVDDRISMGEDGVISFSCIANAGSICICEKAGYHYRLNPNSLTRHKKKYISMEGALLRIEMLEKTLPLKNPAVEMQLSAYAAHAIFNVARSHFKSDSYAQVKKELQGVLQEKRMIDYMEKACSSGSGKERVAALALRKKWFALIKCYSLIQ